MFAASCALNAPPATASDAFELGARLQLDAAMFDGDLAARQDGEMRRVRLQASGKLGERWRYLAHYDFTTGDPRPIDLWVALRATRKHTLSVGNLLTPIGLDAMTTSLDTLFTERALPTDLVPGYRFGTSWRWRERNWTLMTALTAGRLSGVSEIDSALSGGGGGFTVRLAATPWRGAGNAMVHVGAALDLRTPGNDGRLRVRARPESRLAATRLVDTGTLRDVQRSLTGGLELAMLRGPFSFRSELLGTEVQREGERDDAIFWGGYVSGSWMVLGPQRRYSSTNRRFRRFRPAPGQHALELALRYSNLDLQSAAVTGGRQGATSIAMHWYPAPRWRWTINATRARATPDRRGDPARASHVTLRGQYAF